MTSTEETTTWNAPVKDVLVKDVLAKDVLAKDTQAKSSDDYTMLRSMTTLIINKDIREFVEYFFDNEVPEYFKHVPASSTGKYHPAYALGEGGLVRHVIATVKFTVHITALEYLRIDSIMRDKMIAAAMLHDSFKQGLDGKGKYTVKDHARVASQQITKVASATPVCNIDTERSSIARMVACHMGEWEPKCKPGNRYEFLVHLADYLASRKDILIDFSIPTERQKS